MGRLGRGISARWPVPHTRDEKVISQSANNCRLCVPVASEKCIRSAARVARAQKVPGQRAAGELGLSKHLAGPINSTPYRGERAQGCSYAGRVKEH